MILRVELEDRKNMPGNDMPGLFRVKAKDLFPMLSRVFSCFFRSGFQVAVQRTVQVFAIRDGRLHPPHETFMEIACVVFCLVFSCHVAAFEAA